MLIQGSATRPFLAMRLTGSRTCARSFQTLPQSCTVYGRYRHSETYSDLSLSQASFQQATNLLCVYQVRHLFGGRDTHPFQAPVQRPVVNPEPGGQNLQVYGSNKRQNFRNRLIRYGFH